MMRQRKSRNLLKIFIFWLSPPKFQISAGRHPPWPGLRVAQPTCHLQPAPQADQDQRPRRASRSRHHFPTGRASHHRPDGARHPRRNPPIVSATAMRVTAIHTQTERNQPNRSARCAEQHHRRARTRRLRGQILSVPATALAAGATQYE